MEKKKKKIYLYGSLFLTLFLAFLSFAPSVSLADPTNLWSDGTGSILYYNSGNVGIGTTSPSVPLHVYGTTAAISVQYPAGKWGTLLAGTTGAGFGFADTGYFAIGRISSVYATPTNDLYISSSGKVGIGTTSPTEKLYVSGNIYATGNITCGGTCGGGGGSSSFIGLTDVPSTFTGHAGECVRVNSSATALEFFTCPSGGGGTTWGSITGTLSDQTDLSSALALLTNNPMIVYIIELSFLGIVFALAFYCIYNIIKKIL